MTQSILDMTKEQRYNIFDVYFDGIESPDDYDIEFERWFIEAVADEKLIEKNRVKQYRIKCIDMFLSYWCDFLTLARFAEYFEITEHQAIRIINLGRAKHDRNCEAIA